MASCAVCMRQFAAAQDGRRFAMCARLPRMFRSSRGVAREFAAWTAAFAFALNGFAPLAAQSGPGAPPGLHDICTAGGLKRVDSSSGQSGPGESAPRSLHCALCAVRADSTAVAPHFGSALHVVMDFRHEIPAAAREFFPRFRSNPPAPPRAPPLYS